MDEKKVSNLSLDRRLFLRLVSQNEICQLQIAIAGSFGTSVDDSPLCQLLSVFTEQLFIDPKSQWMIVNCFEDGAFWARLRPVYFCGHRESKGIVPAAYNSNVRLQGKKSPRPKFS